MYNETIDKFGYPENLIKEYQHWVILLRPQQVTLGSLVLASKDKSQAMSELSPDAFMELSQVTKEIESALKNLFDYDKINYLVLMMVDKYVHFHVVPRYMSDKVFNDISFKDYGYPKFPDLSKVNDLNQSDFNKLKELMKKNF